MLGLNNNTDTEEMNTPALNGNEGVVQDKQEYNESLVRRGKQQHPPKKVNIMNKYVFKSILLERNINASTNYNFCCVYIYICAHECI